MNKKAIHTDNAPAAIGTYSQAIATGGSLKDAVKITVFLSNLDNFATVNAVMEDFFDQPFPARAVVGVASLSKGVDVEADAVIAI